MKAKKTITFMTLILLLIMASMVLLFYLLGRDVQHEVALSKTAEAAEAVREKFLELAAPIRRDLTLISQWGNSGIIELSDAAALSEKLTPLVTSQPMVAGLIVADTDGREFFMLRQDESWSVRTAKAYVPKMNATLHQLDAEGKLSAGQQVQRTFDPRTRAWFAGALKTEDTTGIFWTEPYRFKTLGKLGITASIRWQDNQNDSIIVVAAMDVLLDTLYHYLSDLRVTPGSQIVLIRNDGTMMPPKMMTNHIGHKDDIAFVDVDELETGLYKNAVNAWTEHLGRNLSTQMFTCEGKTWWAGFQPLQASVAGTWIGVLIPEADLIGSYHKRWIGFVSIGLTLLLAGSILIVFIVRRQSRGTAGSGADTLDDTRVRELIVAGESNFLEFKSTVRTNLKNGKRDKAIELAWLKSVTAFMNSDGGTLLIGVNDDGDIVGIDEDQFENEDKCLLHVKNLVHEHIGSEFAGFIQCLLHGIDGRTVVSLTCAKADVPVFLKIGKNEDFFIRSGPSSTKLSMSKMVSYLEQRK